MVVYYGKKGKKWYIEFVVGSYTETMLFDCSYDMKWWAEKNRVDLRKDNRIDL